ncbi:MAG: sulfatase-like hydrolase/transferase [Acidobacteriota bacterium]
MRHRLGPLPRSRRGIPASFGAFLATWLTVVLSLVLGCGGFADEPWNVLLVTFDTTRADHLGCYGHETIQTPSIDGLARDGVLFERAYASVPITAPSHTTILTGLYPMAHGMRDNGLFVLDDATVTLAERLRDAGYATGAAIGSFPLASQFGLNQGFDLYDDHFTLPYEDFRGERVVKKSRMFFDERPAELVNEPLLAWLDEHHDRAFFAWAHYFDPHLPVEPPPPYDQIYLADPYLGEIAYADEALGQLLAHLDALGVGDRTLVIVTADHGEGRGEHNELTHSTLAYDTTLHVPMVLRIPGVDGGLRVSQRVGTVDLVPTVLDLLGLAVPDGLHGRSMVPLIEGRGAKTAEFPRAQYAETLSPRLSHGLGELRVLYDRGYKYIFGPRPELYRPVDDPRELHDLVDREPEIARAMHQRLERFVQEHATDGGAAAVTMDDETRRRLEALGYLSSTGGTVEVIERLDGSGVSPKDRVADVNEMSTAKNELLNNRPRTALALAETLLRRAPDHVAYLQIQADAQMLLGQIDESIATLQRILELDPQGLPQQQLILQLIDSLYVAGRADEAVQILRGQQDARPTPLGQWYLASLHQALDEPEPAAAALERALELDPSFAPARVDRAIGAAQSGDLERAIREIERALTDRPYFAKAHFNRGVLHLQADEPDAALERFERAVVLHPRYAQARHAVVATALRTGDHERASAAALQLRQIAPGSAWAVDAQRLLAASGPDPATPEPGSVETGTSPTATSEASR